MQIKSRIFGEIEIDDEKIITIPNGIMGFEQYQKYAIAFDSENESKNGIMWLQSLEEENLAFPVMDPMHVMSDYSPMIEDDWLEPIGNFETDNYLYVLSILTVPSDITKMTINLKAPLIINTITRKGIQLIVNNDEYPVRYNVYEHLEKAKKEAGTC